MTLDYGSCMTRTSVCAYPWDLLGDPGVRDRLARLRGAGVTSVAIAAAYHSVRAATPMHPHHQVVDARHAAFYLPVRESVWSGSDLVPEEATAWAGDDSFRRAAEVVRSCGLDVEAWMVLTHSSELGRTRPQLCVRNAFGDVYRYALCPAHPSVVDYAVTLVEETIALGGVQAFMIEASGPLGVGHLGHHEKTSGAEWSEVQEALLSICFCARCAAALTGAGVDPDALAARVREAVRSPAPGDVDDVLGDAARVAFAARTSARAALTRAVSAAARAGGAGRLSFHAQCEEWAVGPFAALLDQPGRAAAAADAFVLPGGVAAGGEREYARARAEAGSAALGVYVSALPPAVPDELATRWAGLVDLGYDELCIYHLGLVSRRRFDAVVAAVRQLP
ncbi:hypothetical protein EDF44_2585 [Rathayibacter sp. PhB185]|nr:hypothetical protein EDF45_2463 [Rathayibacter sp. PhB186]ROS50751.1 hypothetical protein EDF44_2585 [Rathayibacter sp. PhB185]